MNGAGDKNNLSAWEGPFCCLSKHLTVLALSVEGSRAPQCLSAGMVGRGAANAIICIAAPLTLLVT